MLLFIIVGLIINGIVSHIIAKIGEEKSIGYQTAFLISFLLTPLLGVLIVIAAGPKSTTNLNERTLYNTSYGERPLYSDWSKRNPGKTIKEFLERYPNN